MGRSLARKIIDEHLVAGEAKAGSEIGLRIDQTLTQDATGTMAYLQFEAMGIPRVRTKLSVSYVDHNTLQAGFENADDHRFLQTIAAKYGIYLLAAGERDMPSGAPGAVRRPRARRSSARTATRRPAAALGMLAIGAGGLDVALAMAGEPFYLTMPQVVRVNLTGRLPAWVAAKDVILEMLRRSDGEGRRRTHLRVRRRGRRRRSRCRSGRRSRTWARSWERRASLFPSDERTREYLRAQRREEAWIAAGRRRRRGIRRGHRDRPERAGAADRAAASSPDNVVPVREVAGTEVAQVAIGSCTNSSYAT